MRLRQVALVARDLEPIGTELREALALGEPFVDEGVGVFGLRNVVFPVGDTFFEIVQPVREGTTAGRYLERRGGDGGYMVLFEVRDLSRERQRLAGLGVRAVWSIALDDIAAVHLHPTDVGGAIVSFDQPTPPGAWRWGGPGWDTRSRTDRVTGITGVTIQSPDPPRLAARWGEVLGRAVDGDRIELDDGVVRFVRDEDGRGEGIAGVEVDVVEGRAVAPRTIGGVKISPRSRS